MPRAGVHTARPGPLRSEAASLEVVGEVLGELTGEGTHLRSAVVERGALGIAEDPGDDGLLVVGEDDIAVTSLEEP